MKEWIILISKNLFATCGTVLLLLLLGAGIGITAFVMLAPKPAPLTITEPPRILTNHILVPKPIYNYPPECEEIAEMLNSMIEERAQFLETPSAIFVSNEYIYVTNEWRSERVRYTTAGKHRLELGGGLIYPPGLIISVAYSELPIRAGAFIQITGNYGVYAEYIHRFDL